MPGMTEGQKAPCPSEGTGRQGALGAHVAGVRVVGRDAVMKGLSLVSKALPELAFLLHLLSE